MAWTIIDVTSNSAVKYPGTGKNHWDSEQGAKAVLTRMVKNHGHSRDNLRVVSTECATEPENRPPQAAKEPSGEELWQAMRNLFLTLDGKIREAA